jgi:membrane peptidoglycan carboxypeptidase
VPLSAGRPSAAKTGTEGIQVGKYKGGNSDAWMVGYTPQVSAAVWVGSGNSTSPIVNSYGAPEYGRDMPGRTWQLFMNTYLAGKRALPLPTKQMVGLPTQSTSAAPSTSHAPTTQASSQPPATPSSTARTSTAPTTSAPPTTSAAPPTTTHPRPSPSCSPGLVLPNCPSSSPSSSTSSANGAAGIGTATP